IGMRQLNGLYTQAFNRRHKRLGHLFQGRFKAILVEKESYLLELCGYIVLNPLRVKGRIDAASWKWSSYRATAGLALEPEFLSTEWVLGQFGKSRRIAQKRYREFVKDGAAIRPWDDLKGQIYLGSEKFIEKHSTKDQDIGEIPRAQLKPIRPRLDQLLSGNKDTAIGEAYREYGYRLHEIAEHLGVHYATVSRRLRRMERQR